MTYRVVFSPEARADLRDLYHFIADRDGEVRALSYIERIEAYCLSLETFPERGVRRDHIYPGLRVVGFERRVSIAFRVEAASVLIYRILYGGRDLGILESAD